jgi:hypothetical protein
MHELCSTLHVDDLGYAEQQELDVECFAIDLRKDVGGARVADDIDGADLSGFNGTLTFFIHERPLRRLQHRDAVAGRTRGQCEQRSLRLDPDQGTWPGSSQARTGAPWGNVEAHTPAPTPEPGASCPQQR